MNFLKNSWYAIAWSNEIRAGVLLPRTVLGKPLVVFRSEEGQTGVLLDRCPHRFAPLHRGKLIKGGLQCGYHGLVFDNAGACVHNPQGPALRTLAVESYPVQEAHHLVWLWPGEPSRADPAMIPDLSFIDSANPVSLAPGYLHVEAYFELLNDNIMDLSHVDYLHPTTLAQGRPGRSKAHPKTGSDGDRVWIRWDAKDVEPSPMNALYFGAVARIDLTTEVIWQAAGNLRARVTMSTLDAERRTITHACHLMTPETANTTHYFYCGSREFCEDDPKMTVARAEFARLAFENEDKPMIEAVQLAMGHDCDLLAGHPTLLPNDRGAIEVRRKLRTMIQQETERLRG